MPSPHVPRHHLLRKKTAGQRAAGWLSLACFGLAGFILWCGVGVR
jgi:hypothetical protein